MTDWTNNQEDFLKRLHLECHTLSEYNRKQFISYSKINQRFSIPILVISGVNSLFAVSTQNFILQDYISLTNACLSLFCGILGSIQLYMKIDTKIHTFIVCSHEFNKLSYRISKELSLEREVRLTDGKQFLLECFNEFNTILDKQETKEKKLNDFLLLSATDVEIADAGSMITLVSGESDSSVVDNMDNEDNDGNAGNTGNPNN